MLETDVELHCPACGEVAICDTAEIVRRLRASGELRPNQQPDPAEARRLMREAADRLPCERCGGLGLLVAQGHPFKPGDADALAQFIESRRPQLLAYIGRQLGPSLRKKVDAEDLLQEVSAEAVRSLPTAELGDRDPFGWLCQIAQRRAIDAHRRFFGAKKRDAGREVSLHQARPGDSTQQGLVDLLVATMTTASKALSRNEREMRLLAAFAQLPEENREALRLRYVENMPSKQIAERLGKTDGAVRVMLTRSLARLRELLGPDDLP
jgi:RNA polymerase sigma-70 factor (ECF subfamily)